MGRQLEWKYSAFACKDRVVSRAARIRGLRPGMVINKFDHSRSKSPFSSDGSANSDGGIPEKGKGTASDSSTGLQSL
jgi:hypothetical protein